MPLLNESSRLSMLLKQFSSTDYTPTASYSVAAVTTVPSGLDSTGLGEPTDPSYSRIVILNDSAEFGLSSFGSEVINLNEWAFDPASEDWGTVFGIALFDASTAYMGYLPFSSPRFISANNILKIPAGAFIVQSDSTPLSVTIEETLVPNILTAPNGDRYILSVDDTGSPVLTPTTYYGPPSAPTDLLATGTELTWTPAVNDGGTPIISQTIWKADSDSLLIEFDIISPADDTYDVGLDAVGAFFVTADNVVGSSSPSNTEVIS